METFLARRQYDSPILYFGIQGISRTNIESPAKRPGKNDLTFCGYLGLHGKTILPFERKLDKAEKQLIQSQLPQMP